MRREIEIGVGLFMLVGMFALAYLSVRLGQVDLFGAQRYTVYADFPTVGGLKSGASVEIAGVPVGRVNAIRLENSFQARVAMQIDEAVKLQDDAIVSIKTKGLIGEKYVLINPGGSEKLVPPGGRLTEVEAPVDIEELISKYVFGKI
jgi:phospholipid/cholesterol/gamma-HCH transport system substrate-binding protein